MGCLLRLCGALRRHPASHGWVYSLPSGARPQPTPFVPPDSSCGGRWGLAGTSRRRRCTTSTRCASGRRSWGPGTRTWPRASTTSPSCYRRCTGVCVCVRGEGCPRVGLGCCAPPHTPDGTIALPAGHNSLAQQAARHAREGGRRGWRAVVEPRGALVLELVGFESFVHVC